MPASDLLDWATRAISLFNTIVLLWLGLTVPLNAERRTWGTWVVGGGLTLGGFFFVAHTAIVGVAAGILSAEVAFWWKAIWLMLISNPFMWYAAMAWYSGTLRSRRQQVWLAILGAAGIAALIFLLFAEPLPRYDELLQASPVSFLNFGGVPVVTLLYPAYSILCFLLSLSGLRRPGVTTRFMGDLARRRAEPWLVAATLVLLGVSLTIGLAGTWILRGLQERQLTVSSAEMLTTLSLLDLVVSALLAAATVLLGQAIISYEVFTGKALPRGGLFRDWCKCLLLAGGYGTLVGASVAVPVDPIYRLLLATVLMTLFYALLSWRSFLERERGMARLRPFVASQRLYEHLLAPGAPFNVDTATPFRALCQELLSARVAYLVALGPLAPLVGPGLAYPSGAAVSPATLAGLAGRLSAGRTLCLPVDPDDHGGAVWAVPLWSERGLIGVLLLGEKRDGRLYAQEEIEIARTVSERLVDTQASAEMAKRLMALQRQRLAEGQVLDRSGRRMLHDDVLPRLHTSLLALSSLGLGASEEGREVIRQLTGVHRSIADLMRTIPSTTAPEVARFGLLGALRQTVDHDLKGAFDRVCWQIDPEAERLSAALPPLSAEVVYFAAREAVRNAARYGRGPDAARPLSLTVSAIVAGGLRLTVEDDGVGLNASPTSPAGSGQGLALHSTMLAVIGGTLTVENSAPQGTRVVLELSPEVGS